MKGATKDQPNSSRPTLLEMSAVRVAITNAYNES